EPVLDFTERDKDRLWRVDLDRELCPMPPPAEQRAQAFTLWLRSARFAHHGCKMLSLVRGLLEDNPFTTLQVVLEAKDCNPPDAVRPQLLARLMTTCQTNPTYLDKFYGLQPGRINGAKRLVILLPLAIREKLSREWIETVGEYASLIWRNGSRGTCSEDDAVL